MTIRKPIITGNWKMYTTVAEGLALVDELLPRLQLYSAVERIVCPPFVSLSAIADRLRGIDVAVGAQNMYPEPKGAFTGEISPVMLEGLATYVILGHSERRGYFHEDDALINRKVKSAIENALVPIVCVGETLEQKERGEAESVVTRQVRGALQAVDHLSAVVMAYEPVWAVGTGRAATPEDANSMSGLIRRTVAEIGGPAIGEGLQVQYGGSVTGENFGAFIAQPEIDGALVGGASLKADPFIEIVRLASLHA